MTDVVINAANNTKSEVFKVGEYFILGNCLYVLASLGGDSVALIAAKGGNRWNEPCRVKCVSLITEGEFREICCDEPATRVSSVNISYTV